MKRRSAAILLTLAVLVIMALVARYGFTTTPIKEVTYVVWDPAIFVDENWATRVLPAFEKPVELSTILTKMQLDENGMASTESLIPIAQRYGLITMGESHVYAVNGHGKIVHVDVESSRGTVEVELDSYNGPITVLIYIGPRLPSMDSYAIRDAAGFRMDEFPGMEIGVIPSYINERALSEALEGLDRDKLHGKIISFKGAFSITTFNQLNIELNEIRIVPLEIDLD
jgi:predicted lipoprotein